MLDYVVAILLIVFMIGGGIFLLFFAPSVQAYFLRYQPPEWSAGFFRAWSDAVLRGPSYPWSLRVGGLAMIVMGVLLAIAVSRGRVSQ